MTRRRITCLVLPAVAAIVSSVLPARAENWPRFRGPTGQGVSAEKNLPLHWSATENVAWKTAIPGAGWSSPVVWGDRVFLTSAADEGRSCRVICVDRRTGDIRWNVEALTQQPRHKRPDNSYATPTPVADGEHVYAVFGSGGVAAVTFDGDVVWTNEDVDFFSQHGLGASPILHGDLLVMPYDGSSPDEEVVGFKRGWDGAVILALDKHSGHVRWRGRRGLSRLAHVTPQVLDRDGVVQLVSAAGDVVQGHDLRTGELAWTVHSQGEGVTPSIVFGDDVAYACSGFEAPTIRAVRFGGAGDVTDTHIAWEQTKGVPSIASLTYVPPYLYSVTEGGVLTCLDAATGQEAWRKRIGGRHTASPVYADGRIYFLAEEDGVSVVIQPGAEYRELARNSVGELCRASLAASQGNFFLRTEHNLLCIGPPPQP